MRRFVWEYLKRNDCQELFRPAEAAKFFHVHPSSVRRWCEEGLMQYTETQGGHRRISRAHLIAWGVSMNVL